MEKRCGGIVMMIQRSSGMALWIVLFAAMLVGFVLSIVLMQQKRDSDLVMHSNDHLKFIEVLSRVKNIFESRALCTCNLRGLTIEPSGPITYSSRMRIDASAGPTRPVFGYYKLNPSDPSGCETVSPAIDPMTDSVLNLQQGAEYPTALNATFFQISQYELMQTLSPTLSRYKAKLTFGVSENFKTAKSNIQSPLEFDVYVEVISGPQNIIKQCFQPKAIPTPATTLSDCRDGEITQDPDRTIYCCENLINSNSRGFLCSHGRNYDPLMNPPRFDAEKCCAMMVVNAASKTCECTGGWLQDRTVVPGCEDFRCP